MSFTKGPWIAEAPSSESEDLWILAKCPDGDMISIAEVRNGCGEADDIGDVEDNARLICSAPEMFDMIRRINAHLVRPEKLGDLIDDADKLIEKIEGRS